MQSSWPNPDKSERAKLRDKRARSRAKGKRSQVNRLTRLEQIERVKLSRVECGTGESKSRYYSPERKCSCKFTKDGSPAENLCAMCQRSIVASRKALPVGAKQSKVKTGVPLSAGTNPYELHVRMGAGDSRISDTASPNQTGARATNEK